MAFLLYNFNKKITNTDLAERKCRELHKNKLKKVDLTSNMVELIT